MSDSESQTYVIPYKGEQVPYKVIKGDLEPTPELTPVMLKEISDFFNVGLKLAKQYEDGLPAMRKQYQKLLRVPKGKNAWENFANVLMQNAEIQNDIRYVEQLYLQYFSFIKDNPVFIQDLYLGWTEQHRASGMSPKKAEEKAGRDLQSLFRLFNVILTQPVEEHESSDHGEDSRPTNKPQAPRAFPPKILELSYSSGHFAKEALKTFTERKLYKAEFPWEDFVGNEDLRAAIITAGPQVIPLDLFLQMPYGSCPTGYPEYFAILNNFEKELERNSIRVSTSQYSLDADELCGDAYFKAHHRPSLNKKMTPLIEKTLSDTEHKKEFITFNFTYTPPAPDEGQENVVRFSQQKGETEAVVSPYQYLSRIKDFVIPRVISHSLGFTDDAPEYVFEKTSSDTMTLRITKNDPLALFLQQLSERQVLDHDMGYGEKLKDVSSQPLPSVRGASHEGKNELLGDARNKSARRGDSA